MDLLYFQAINIGINLLSGLVVVVVVIPKAYYDRKISPHPLLNIHKTAEHF